MSSLKKIALGVLLILVIYVVSQKYSNNQELFMPTYAPGAIIDEGKEYVLNNNSSRFVRSLSPLLVQTLFREMELKNLKSEIAQNQFLKCAAKQLIVSNVSMHLPPIHQHCTKMSFKNSGPVVALASYPGSGNSWVRQLLESSTGVYTGTVYCDKSYIEVGMIGEGITTNNVIAIKTHYPYTRVKKQMNPDKVIYIVRSPFKCILSENNRRLVKKAYRESNGMLSKKETHILEVDYNYANNSQWKKNVIIRSDRWANYVKGWLNVKEIPVLVVGYENLVKDTYTELKRMLNFIGYPYSEDDVLCSVKSSGESFHRNHKKRLINPYSPELQEYVLGQIKTIDARLLEHDISLYHPYTI